MHCSRRNSLRDSLISNHEGTPIHPTTPPFQSFVLLAKKQPTTLLFKLVFQLSYAVWKWKAFHLTGPFPCMYIFYDCRVSENFQIINQLSYILSKSIEVQTDQVQQGVLPTNNFMIWTINNWWVPTFVLIWVWDVKFNVTCLLIAGWHVKVLL